MLFWVMSLVTVAADKCKNEQLVRSLRMFGFYSLLLVLMSCAALQWNDLRRVGSARRRTEKVRRRAPTGFIARIPTVPYDPELCGAEDGRPYAGECPHRLHREDPHGALRSG